MKGRPVEELVYEYLFPRPRQSDPQNWNSFLQRCLIQEVRNETHSFYGHIDSLEAKYPGLDYTHPVHRIRLSRWPWHRRLFRAFDALRLTPAEIQGLAHWEGTKWAKERYEADHNVIIRDTTADGFPNYVNPDDPYSAQSIARRRAQRQAAREHHRHQHDEAATEENPDENEEDEDEESQSDEDENEAAASSMRLIQEQIRLQQQQAQQALLRSQPQQSQHAPTTTTTTATLHHLLIDPSIPLDEAWETWLKNAIENGELSHVTDQIARYTGTTPHTTTLTIDDIFPSRVMAAARAGRWDEIPPTLHGMIRSALETADRSRSGNGGSSRPPVQWTAVRFTTTAAPPQWEQGRRH
ncbi:uncharacterized protein CTHT_0056970 [Thermochaetoides thermophila DSM 1495]|uniref:Uncharacterized protein n=1 Tax=Chaetomium thermophilum (strain DSM 1495 / CBS 144.50 / IMI 039719) TaxID=759272 RepID=G0SCE9_CHATD|nr:hypothetical protein CTHT_0056970 [Thermochaetoides thermophila DSM 1495]EGS19075.1 hypothetical protein CTHT_0056970 [Thermochaetoides thermophila DSM 1495]